jgi:hypothetical protein
VSLYRVLMRTAPCTAPQQIVDYHNTMCPKGCSRGTKAGWLRRTTIKHSWLLRETQHQAARLFAVLVVLGLAEGEWDVAVLDHMLDLLPHCGRG